MKLFKLSVNKVDYDECSFCVVVAEDEAAVKTMLKESRWPDGDGVKKLCIDGKETGVSFCNHQGEILVEEVDLTRPSLVCAAFNTD